MFYEKKIMYLDLYEKGEKKQNAGYVRLEVYEEVLHLQVFVEKLRHTDTGAYDVILIGKNGESVPDKITLEEGRGFLQIQKECVHMTQDLRYEEIQQIIVKLSGDRRLQCEVPSSERKTIASLIPTGEERKDVQNHEKNCEACDHGKSETGVQDGKKAQSPERAGGEGDDGNSELNDWVGREAETEEKAMWQNGNFQERSRYLQHPPAFPCRKGQSATKWQELWKIYPHICPFGDKREYLRIMPQDFVLLSKAYYPLVTNSFLCHGYLNYEHLILARRLCGEQERFYIGVPGNFYTKEKQVAVLFGFECFEGKTEPAKEGDFGYYMISVEL